MEQRERIYVSQPPTECDHGQKLYMQCDDCKRDADRMFAAAPEMLTAIQDIAGQKPAEWQGGFMEWAQEIAGAVIAKATA